uniref:Fe2OG dioxygenase domain-containing protein n=1 Tax=Arcella intermedia TaxID=1963864 RepID=A0A6B2LFP7_9EUKA
MFNLMTPEEADHLYNVAKTLEKSESKVGADSASSVLSKVRTSSHTWMGKENNGTVGRWHVDDIVNLVEDRIFELTRLDQTTSEPFQVVFYNKDQFYYGHHDYTTREVAPHNPYYQGGGNRFITVLLYLNEVEEGGETAFPFVDANGKPLNRNIHPEEMYKGNSACESGGVKLKPRKGGAAMFYNLKERGHMDGVVEPYSVHSGCPVLQGEKYITNKWIRNKRVDGKLYDEFW